MKNLLEQMRSIMRLAQAVSDAISYLEKALLKEHPSKPKAEAVREITEPHLLYHQYHGHWPPNGHALLEFMEDMGFEEE